MFTRRTKLVTAVLTTLYPSIFLQLGDKVNKVLAVDKTDEVFCLQRIV